MNTPYANLSTNEFSIDFEYHGHRMARVREVRTESILYYDCMLFIDNVLRIHFESGQWRESITDYVTPLAAALGKAISNRLEMVIPRI